GLAQKFLEASLKIEVSGPAKGVILEIKEEKGLGVTADAIIYDGYLKTGDAILFGGYNKVIFSKVKALFQPLPLVEMRLSGRKFQIVKEIYAATGVKIVAQNLDMALAGAPIYSYSNEEMKKEFERKILEEIEAVTLNTQKPGVILKADTLGSLEALSSMLKDKNIPVQKLAIGPIDKNDVMEAKANLEKSPLTAFVLGFNVGIDADAKSLAESSNVCVIIENVIYHLIDKLNEMICKKKEELEKKEFENITWPAKFKILSGFIFRQTKPAIFGVEVLCGKIKPRAALLLEDGRELGEIKSIELEGQKVNELCAGQKAAISVEGVTIGRQIKENDVLYINVDENSFRKLKMKKEILTEAEVNCLKEICEIKRKIKPTWGV
ncbi:MAG: translation initiation factor IF-2, partial [Candidatus Nanoarchaeia archaeon]